MSSAIPTVEENAQLRCAILMVDAEISLCLHCAAIDRLEADVQRDRLFLSIATFYVMTSSASAQQAAVLESKMNESQICTPLSLDSAAIIEQFDPSDLARIALQQIDTNIAWDKNFHKVTEFSQSNGVYVLKADIGCRPSDQGAGAQVLAIMGVGTERLQLSDNMECSGALDSLNCKLSGFIGQQLSQQHKLNETIKQIIGNTR